MNNYDLSKIINKYRLHDPDSIFDYDSTTFLYNPETNELHYDEYPETHHDLIQGSARKTARDKNFNNRDNAIHAGMVLGRFKALNDSDIKLNDGTKTDDLKVIAFWNAYFPDNENWLEKCMEAIFKIAPEYSDKKTIVIFDTSRIDPKFYYKDFKSTRRYNDCFLEDISEIQLSQKIKKNYTAKPTARQDRPECAVTLDVKGQPTKLDVILGNFHMVKDDRLPAMKNAVCSQGVKMKDDLEKAGCDLHLAILNQLIDKSNCNQSGEYQRLKQGGKIQRKQELRKIFDSPELTAQTFRTQKELDAAWDELQGEHAMTGFSEWLNSSLTSATPKTIR